ncbi:uncharacterized protein [Venturia canescens]|uniref:uncharacterized protein n=1 Tax=Venturia canescens TaxID=32260 RepID=UPI001C9D2360|nr:uncharacterized protein LOC122410277 [Venturia canescens]
MAQTMKSSLRMSMAMRNLGTLTNYTATKQFSRMSAHCLSNFDKESLVLPRPMLCKEEVPASITRSLRLSLKDSKTPEQIFYIVKKNKNIMTEIEVIIAFNKLVDTSKIIDKSEKMYENEGFLILCELLKQRMRSLDGTQCLNAFKALMYFNVPTTSIIVQMILQMLRRNLNTLRLDELSFFDFILQKCSRTPLVMALMEAVPIVYETKLATELDRDNIIKMRNALSYLSRKSAKEESYNIIIHALMDRKELIDPDLAHTILWGLCRLNEYPSELPEILKYIQDILTENNKHIHEHLMLDLLSRIVSKVKSGKLFFYHEGFIDACASRAISEDWSLTNLLTLLLYVKQLSHVQISLLDFIAGKCFENQKLLETCSSVNIADLVDGFAMADYKPIFWDVVQEAITSDRILEAKESTFPLSKLSLDLLALDVYCPKLLKKTFETYIANTPSPWEKKRISLLYQVVKTLYPQYSGPFPDVSEFDFSQPLGDFPLLSSLEAAVGGSTYVISNIRTKLGHVIDHAVVLRKGGFPVAVNRDGVKTEELPAIQLEDIKPPVDSRVILILYLSHHAYSLNTQRIKGTWRLQIRSLEAFTGYTVVPIGSVIWGNLSASQKIPYLMQAIRLRCDEHSLYANS